MRRLLCQLLFTGIILLLLLGNVFAQDIQLEISDTQAIPAGFQSLVPEGFTLVSPQTHKAIPAGGVPEGVVAFGGVSFLACKRLDPTRLIEEITYHFDLRIAEYPDAMIEMLAPAYRDKLEEAIKEQLKSWTSRHEENEFSLVVSYDKPQLTRYSWGAGITQRATHIYVGGGEGPDDEIAYECSYLGLLIDKRSMKWLEFSASGVGTPEEADAWAAKAAEKAAQTYFSDL